MHYCLKVTKDDWYSDNSRCGRRPRWEQHLGQDDDERAVGEV